MIGTALAVATFTLAWRFGGIAGVGYLFVYALSTVPGWRVGRALFGRHPVGLVAGLLLGYVGTAVALWAAIRLGARSGAGLAAAWFLLSAASLLFRRQEPLVALPRWERRDTTALLLVLLLVPALIGPPFLNVGARDADGNRHYRAYFTADFLWHVALTAELARFELPPPNPYTASERLHYYWTYFLVPAAVTGATSGGANHVETFLEVNALCGGLVFVALIFAAAWTAVPRAGAVALAALIALTAASAEGVYALADLYTRGRPLASVTSLNIDAITLWFLKGLTIDGLPRSLWYTPQHAAACGLGLIALIVATAAGIRARLGAILLAGVALAGSVACSPFLGGAFASVYGLTIALQAARRPWSADALVAVVRHTLVAAPVLLAIGWCILNDMLEGAGGALTFGVSPQASNAPFKTLVLALGPVLVPALAGLWPGMSLPIPRHAVAGLAIGTGLFYFVSLAGPDPIWVGWRAGQVLLVTLPALAARAFARWAESPRWRPLGMAVAAIALVIGLPTTLIDVYNAQDITNRQMGPGFRWTVSLTPAQQAAFEWIRRATPPDAVVQMEPTVRGRETWTLIPTFAQRRMAAGLPISLVWMPYYEAGSRRIRALYGTTDAAEAWGIATRSDIDYLYLDRVERDAFPPDAIAKFDRHPQYFRRVYANDTVAIYAVSRSN